MAQTAVARNPFARGEYLRETCLDDECANCGNRRHVLFSYAWQQDSVFSWQRRHSPRWSHAFCNLGCYRDFHHLNRAMQPVNLARSYR